MIAAPFRGSFLLKMRGNALECHYPCRWSACDGSHLYGPHQRGCGVRLVRLKPTPKPPGEPSDLDGPSSFGKLQGTLTLDCLRRVGFIQHKGKEHVLIKDERGEVHELSVGQFIEQNGGYIDRIDDDFIYIEQFRMVEQGAREENPSIYKCCSVVTEYRGAWELRHVTFSKYPATR